VAVVQVLVRQQDLRVVVDDFAGAANRYGALLGIAIDRILVGVANDLLLGMAPAQADPSRQRHARPLFLKTIPLIGSGVSPNTKVWHFFFLVNISRISARSWLRQTSAGVVFALNC
jgi:hypothetical protein